MKKWLSGVVVFILILVNLNLILSSDNINVNYPDTIYSGEEFSVNITLNNFNESIYDLKFEALEGNHNILNRYWDSQWKSSLYWIYGAINLTESNSMTYKLKADEDIFGEKNLSIKIKSGSKTIDFDGYIINIIQKENNPNNQNITNKTNNQNITNVNNMTSTKPEITMSFSWDEDDIKNGDTFTIRVKAFNLKDKEYDLKAFIYDEDDESKLMSEFSNQDDTWTSSTRYYIGFFNGPLNKSEDIKLRIKESYRYFFGSAKIGFKLRENGGNIVKEYNEDIDVSKVTKTTTTSENDTSSSSVTSSIKKTSTTTKSNSTKESSLKTVTGNVIKLQNSDERESIKTQKNTVYQSKNELIKKYSVYGFIFLTVILVILIVFVKFR